jgi:uncharacterized protein (TIGR03086 family)
MDATTALHDTDRIVTGLIAGLTTDQREHATPCDEWTVHDLIAHMCGGGHLIARTLLGEEAPDPPPDHLADGPGAGWTTTVAHLRSAATPEVLTANHQTPFGEVPGEAALSVIVADHLTHAWDLARASGQAFEIDDELADFALATWRTVVPAEGRTGPGFKAAVPVGDDPSAVARLIGYTGRDPEWSCD